MTFDKVVGTDQDSQLPDKVRTRTGLNIQDEDTPEGGAVASVVGDKLAPISADIESMKNLLQIPMVEDPNDPGTYIIQNPTINEDPSDPGLFIIGYPNGQ